MKNLLRAGAMALALVTCMPAMAQQTTGTADGSSVPVGGALLVGKNGVEKGTTGNPLVTSSASYLAAASWAGTSFDARANGSATIAVTAAPTTAYAIQWSADNATWTALTCIDLSFNTASAIPTTFTGALSCQAGGYIRLNGGTGGTFLIGAGQ